MHDSFQLDLDTDIQNLGRVGCALHNHELFDAYVELRLHGIHSAAAFRQAFAECEGITRRDADNLFFDRLHAIEYDPYVTGRLRDRLAVVKPQDLWNTNIAVNEILSLARDPMSKCSTRLNAMKELNVLIGITVVDENGKTKAGRSLDDFYRDVEAKSPAEVLEEENKDVVSSSPTE